MTLDLVIGTRRWSSWSLRPWLALRRSGLAFQETVVPLRESGTTEAAIRAAGSPSGLVPVLRIDGEAVWDSLAICERLAELAPEAALWPAAAEARAQARSVSAEMHAGFHSLRGECPMDLSRPPAAVTLSEATHRDIRRIVQLIGAARSRFGAGGEFLFGAWSIADAFYTPVATRFRTYGVTVSDFGDTGEAGRYVERLLETPEFRDWEAAAARET